MGAKKKTGANVGPPFLERVTYNECWGMPIQDQCNHFKVPFYVF